MKATAKKVQEKVQEKPMASKALASKAKAVQAKEEAPEKDAEGAPESPLPLLDLNDAGVKKMIKAAKKRGYVTHEQINAVMPSEEVTSDQIEDVFAMLNDMGINVVETEREGATDGPLLDLSDDAVKKMIKAAKKRGYVTMDELNSVLPYEAERDLMLRSADVLEKTKVQIQPPKEEEEDK
jgi:RNA polymerase primary sigma factor